MTLDVWLLLGPVIVIAAIGAVRLVHRTGLPSLLVFLGFGLLMSSGFGVVLHNPETVQKIGLAALALILAEGGLTTTWSHVRRSVPLAMVLATVGVAVSTVVVAVVVRYALDLDMTKALILGAVLASTDAAAVFSVLRRLPLPPRLAGALEAESGINDAPTVIAVMLLSSSAHADAGLGTFLLETLVELVIGAAVGLAVGPAGAYALRHVALPASGLYPIAALALTFVAYGGAALLHGSGFLAIYLTGVILGNSRLPHRAATRGFAEGAGWLAQIGLFVMLGMLAEIDELPSAVVPALITGTALVLLARPVSVAVSAAVARVLRVDRVSWRDQAFLSWAGLRGAVPIVLATIPWAAGVEGSEDLFNQVFVIVIVFTLVQGPTLPFAARLLGVGAPGEAHELMVESAPLEELNADLLQVKIPPGSKLHGVEIFELRFPSGAAVTLVVRDGRSFVPEGSTRLRVDDELLVVTTAACRDEVETRLRAVSRRGKLAGWYGEQGLE
ncbi:cell volume regulation protein A [Nonomuraea maritima]|uniref:Cell volume regulation protein A n=1 Tax=Nonomuraea maritima TaxID=683260 RepID=A0A1G9SA67_9ACTN|nr:potassium/proton antiporter [Nonomuraea maritima]SDM31675.1 cell volume regulation protein A [Nonomuraea maritima]